jgi:hypothetical protein
MNFAEAVKALTCAKAVAVDGKRRFVIHILEAAAALQAQGNIAQNIRPLSQRGVDILAGIVSQ